jgi:hypothetical protein
MDERMNDLGDFRAESQELRRELRELRRLQIKVWATMVGGFVALFVENSLR